MDKLIYDFVVVGSGVSGGRMADELSRSGARVALLEAGKHFERSTFPKNEMDYSAQLFWGGGMELTRDGRLGLLRARCVGGTSIVNQALLDEFDEDVWSDWRSRTGSTALSAETMAEQYRALRQELSISEIPREHWNENAKIFTRALEIKSLGWKSLQRGQKDCALEKGSDCLVCLGGCPRGSKQSSLETTVKNAIANGCELIADFEIEDLLMSKEQVMARGWQRGVRKEVIGNKLVLAAGALGNTGILLRSNLNKELPALGKGFSCHPQFMSYGVFEQQVDAHKGAFQVVKSYDPKLRKMGVKLENVFAPPIGTAMLLPGLGLQHQQSMKQYRHMASMEVALRDEAVGRIRLQGKKLVIEKSLTDFDKQRAKAGQDLIDEMLMAAGAKTIYRGQQGFGLHLMGGCALGADPKESVVSPEFHLHGYKNVYAADSSIFPSAPGINPSFSIMAFSRMAAQKILGAAK